MFTIFKNSRINFNRKRHKTLKILSSKLIQFESGQTAPDFILGVDFKDIQTELNADRNTCELIFSPLYDNKEVEFTNVKVEGLFLSQKGLTSFSNEKYLKENNKIIVNWLKNFVQIVIPILALLIAYVSLTSKMNSLKTQSDKELKEVKKSILEQKERIEKLEKRTKNMETDSLKNE